MNKRFLSLIALALVLSTVCMASIACMNIDDIPLDPNDTGSLKDNMSGKKKDTANVFDQNSWGTGNNYVYSTETLYSGKDVYYPIYNDTTAVVYDSMAYMSDPETEFYNMWEINHTNTTQGPVQVVGVQTRYYNGIFALRIVFGVKDYDLTHLDFESSIYNYKTGKVTTETIGLYSYVTGVYELTEHRKLTADEFGVDDLAVYTIELNDTDTVTVDITPTGVTTDGKQLPDGARVVIDVENGTRTALAAY